MALLCEVAIEKDVSGALKFLGWCAAFVLPLVLIHGIVNPQFAATTRWLDVVPIRPNGILFGLRTGAMIACLFVPMLYWARVSRADVLGFFASCRLPRPALLALFQAISLSKQIQLRSNAIITAQQARGIDTRGSFGVRVRALLPVLLPLTVALLREVPVRAAIQDFTRSGHAAFAVCSVRRPTGREVGILMLSTAGFLVIAFLNAESW
jgi:energy-coupling factor transporter transmembrane protein EcfT